jgi:hypothetical protein
MKKAKGFTGANVSLYGQKTWAEAGKNGTPVAILKKITLVRLKLGFKKKDGSEEPPRYRSIRLL